MQPIFACMQVQVHAEADPSRILQPTLSTLAEATPTASAFRPVHGYSTATITADRRFRAAEAMAVCGMLHRPAARAALRSVYERNAPRRLDCLTSAERETRGGASRSGVFGLSMRAK
jgi:hypothetical protein